MALPSTVVCAKVHCCWGANDLIHRYLILIRYLNNLVAMYWTLLWVWVMWLTAYYISRGGSIMSCCFEPYPLTFVSLCFHLTLCVAFLSLILTVHLSCHMKTVWLLPLDLDGVVVLVACPDSGLPCMKLLARYIWCIVYWNYTGICI